MPAQNRIMNWIRIFLVMGTMNDSDIILVNDTGLSIARIEIDDRKFEAGDSGLPPHNKVLVSVTPTTHDLRVVFRGGGDVEWPKFNFAHVHEVFFVRWHNKIAAHKE